MIPPVNGSKVVGFCPKNSDDDILCEGKKREREREKKRKREKK